MRLIEVEADMAEGAAHLAAICPVWARVLPEIGEMPLRRREDGFAAILDAVISQQLSVASANAIQALVAQHSLDLDPKRVVIGGFSQGCAVALLAGLTKGTEGREKEVERNLAGVVGQSDLKNDSSLQ